MQQKCSQRNSCESLPQASDMKAVVDAILRLCLIEDGALAWCDTHPEGTKFSSFK